MLTEITTAEINEICEELQMSERYYHATLKNRIKLDNALTATVAVWMGYSSFGTEEDRTMFLISFLAFSYMIVQGKEHDLKELVLANRITTDQYQEVLDKLVKQMERFVKQLPIIDWINAPAQSGFGIKGLARIIGEAGNISNYDRPGKLWKRFGLAPFESKGKSLAASTWRKGTEGSLSSDEWTKLGYSPRRRSIMYIISDAALKHNKDIYRKRYDEAKASFIARKPQECTYCKGTGKNTRNKTCSKCNGNGEWFMRAHRHGLLVMSKLFLKELWMQWNPTMVLSDDELRPNRPMLPR